MMPALEFFRLKTREEVLALYPRFPAVGVEEVELAQATGRVLAVPLAAPEDVPAFLRASMDGYAVAGRDTFGASVGAPQYLQIKGDIPMGAAPERALGHHLYGFSPGASKPSPVHGPPIIELSQDKFKKFPQSADYIF